MHQLTRLLAVALTGSLAACGGGDKSAESAAGGNTTSTMPAASPAASTGGAAITGKTVKVQMIGDQQGYRYDPATITIKAGDGLTFVNVTGGPHNVTFWPDSIPAGAAAAVQANMPNTMAPLTGPLLTNPSDTYTISFAGAKPGTYKFYCTPHLALGMKGTLTVQ